MTEGCHHAKFQAVCVRSFRENVRHVAILLIPPPPVGNTSATSQIRKYI